MNQDIKSDVRQTVVPAPSAAGQPSVQTANRMSPNQRINAAVKRSWERVLEPSSFEAGLSFDMAGGDSLRLLKFAFFLEQELRTDLPLDLFWPTMCPHAVASAIDGHLAGTEGTVKQATLHVHVLPGRSRDEQRLVRFRNSYPSGENHLAVLNLSADLSGVCKGVGKDGRNGGGHHGG